MAAPNLTTLVIMNRNPDTVAPNGAKAGRVDRSTMKSGQALENRNQSHSLYLYETMKPLLFSAAVHVI